MTTMPELVAGFHSLVGLAAVFVEFQPLNPSAFNLGSIGNIKIASLIEMSIGAAVGAITFSGSLIAFLKLRGIIWCSYPFKGQHFLNLFLYYSLVLIYSLANLNYNLLDGNCNFILSWSFTNYSDWWSDIPVVISMLNLLGWAGRNRFYIREYSFNYWCSYILWCNFILYNAYE